MIISVNELKKMIGEEDLVLVDCFYNWHEYRRGHIPTAIKRIGHPYVKTGDEDNPGLLYPEPAEFEERMNCMGIGPRTTVVAYDSDGSLFAARFLWGLLYYGHKKVKLLNGGWQAWINAGFPVSVKIFEPQINPEKFKATRETELVITKEQLLETYQQDCKIIDVRSPEEYYGHDDRGNKRSGRIPGASLIEWTDLLQNANTTEKLSTIKNFQDIKKILEEVSISRDDKIITYCQGGVRASLVAYILRAMGYNTRVYDGSMNEWANLETTPLD